MHAPGDVCYSCILRALFPATLKLRIENSGPRFVTGETQTFPGERRVALTPKAVESLVKAGFRVRGPA